MVKSMAIPDLGQTKRWFTVSDRPKKKINMEKGFFKVDFQHQ